MEESQKKYLTFMTKTAQKMTIFFQELANEGQKFYTEMRKQLKTADHTESHKKQHRFEQAKISGKFKSDALSQYQTNSEVKKNGKKKQSEAQKDQKKPKPPDSSFQIYLKQNQAEIQKSHGESNKFNIMKLASQLWKSLPEQKKQEYQQKAQKDRFRYQQQTKSYDQGNESTTKTYKKVQTVAKKYISTSEPQQQSKLMRIVQNSSEQASDSKQKQAQYIDEEQSKLKKDKAKKRKKDLGTQIETLKPKAPTSSFLLFLHENKKVFSQKYGVRTNSQLTKIASKQWKLISEQTKQQYIQKSELSKQNYHERMKEYNQKYADELAQIRQRKKQISKQKSREKKKIKRQASIIQKGQTGQKSNSQSLQNSEDSLMESSLSNLKREDSF